MQSRIERFSRLEDAEGDMNELSHHGADDEHGGFACSGQTQTEALPPGRFIQCSHSRHIEGFAQEGMADFGESLFAVDATAGLMLTRIEAGEGRGLPGVAKSLGVRIVGEQDGDRAFAEARDAIEQFSLGIEVVVVA